MRASIRMLSWATVAAALAATASPPRALAAVTSTDLLACQKAIETQVRGYVGLVAGRVIGCTEKVDKCKLADEIDGVDPTACLAAATTSCGGLPSKLATDLATRKSRVVLKCGLIALDDLKAFVAGLGFFNIAAACPGPPADAAGLIDCIFDENQCSTEKQIFLIDPRAPDALTTLGIAGDFACVGP